MYDEIFFTFEYLHICYFYSRKINFVYEIHYFQFKPASWSSIT